MTPSLSLAARMLAAIHGVVRKREAARGHPFRRRSRLDASFLLLLGLLRAFASPMVSVPSSKVMRTSSSSPRPAARRADRYFGIGFSWMSTEGPSSH